MNSSGTLKMLYKYNFKWLPVFDAGKNILEIIAGTLKIDVLKNLVSVTYGKIDTLWLFIKIC